MPDIDFSVNSELNYIEISGFIKSVFDEFNAFQYTRDGIQEFYNYIESGAIRSRQSNNHFLIPAVDADNELCGIIEVRNYSHISLLFVRGDSQRQGLGTRLLNSAIDYSLQKTSPLPKITLNSTPNAVDAYLKMGFIKSDIEQCINGIKFQPMEMKLSTFES